MGLLSWLRGFSEKKQETLTLKKEYPCVYHETAEEQNAFQKFLNLLKNGDVTHRERV